MSKRIAATVMGFEDNVDRLFVKPGRNDSIGRMVHAAMGACGETGELADAVKKHWIYGKELDVENVKEEIGDTLFYLQALATECGITLIECMDSNMEKLAERYPDGYTDAAAQARADKIGLDGFA